MAHRMKILVLLIYWYLVVIHVEYSSQTEWPLKDTRANHPKSKKDHSVPKAGSYPRLTDVFSSQKHEKITHSIDKNGIRNLMLKRVSIENTSNRLNSAKISKKSFVITPRSSKGKNLKHLQYLYDTGSEKKKTIVPDTRSAKRRTIVPAARIKCKGLRKGGASCQSKSEGDLSDTNENEKKDIVYFKSLPHKEKSTKRFKKMEITNMTKKTDISQINLPESVQQQPQAYPRNLGTKIGKAYGDPDNYQPLGDGVYLLNDATKGGKVKQIKDNLPDTQKSLNEILSNLDEEDSNILDASKTGDVRIPLSVGNNNEESSFGQRGVGARDMTVSIASRQNVEDVTPNEVNMINDIEDSLKIDDKKANQVTNEFTPTDSGRHVLSEGEDKPKGFDELAKAADKLDREFVDQDPYVIKSDDHDKRILDKKDRTVSKRTSDTDFLIARINDADEKLQDFAGSSDFNMDDYDENRAKDIAELAVEEDKEIMVDGQKKIVANLKKQKSVKKLVPKNVAIEKSSDAVSPVDTGFITETKGEEKEESKDEDIPQTIKSKNTDLFTQQNPELSKKTKNLSIESSSDAVSPVDTGFFMDGNEDSNITFYGNSTLKDEDGNDKLQQKNKSKVEKVKNHNHKNFKSKSHKSGNKKDSKQTADKQDLNLINKLNQTDPKFGTHHLGSAWTVNSSENEPKHIHLPGEHGVQIDLFITSEKGKAKKSENVGRSKPTKDTVRGTKKFVTASSHGLDYQTEDNNEEVVNMNGPLTDQFAVQNSMQDYNSPKISSMNRGGDLQQESHQDGNGVKEYNDVSIQDGINSDELKDAIKESDLKGLKQIRTELDAQDLRTAMDYFGKAEKAEREHLRPIGHPFDATLSASNSGIDKLLEDGEETAFKDEKGHEKVTTILHILQLLSKKRNEKHADEENVSEKEYLTKNNMKNGSSLEDTARKIEEFINFNKGTKSNEILREEKGANSQLTVSNAPKEPDSSAVPNEESIIGALLRNVNSKNKKEEEKEKDVAEAKDDQNSEALEVIRNLFKTKTPGNDKASALQKMLITPDESEPLQINGGKILGGNVRGGRILGGVVTGGNITGGEMEGGRIAGGTFQNGLFINGLMENGVIEGGKIRGGKILGGVIKAGVIDGGVVKGGAVLGGHLYNGTISGGIFKGGDIYDGNLISGEMDGGTMKGGRINGGTLKGGVIESGSLDGGVMLSGILRGGVVKSGVIKGGVVDKGVVVQDAEIGPGVEIHEGIIKGGRITANDAKRTHELSSHGHSDENRSNIMYSIEVPPTKDGVNTIDESQENAINKDEAMLGESLESLSDKKDKTGTSQKKSLNINEMLNTVSLEEKKRNPKTSQEIRALVDKEAEDAAKDDPNLKRLLSMIKSPIDFSRRTITKTPVSTTRKPKPTTALAVHRKTTNQGNMKSSMIANWDLSTEKFNTISGKPGPDLKLFNGVEVRNGHAVLDGQHGYLDAGDFQGECFSDPEVCEHGFTIQMTLKIYQNSVYNDKRQFILDSGATLSNSRGMSLWVGHGKIHGMVSTSENVWCLNKPMPSFADRWISLTMTWRKSIGLQLYINCDLFDQSNEHQQKECDECTNCHKTDISTRLMFGRPNKGPHFKVIHMAVGEISLYEKYASKYEVDMLCGSSDNPTPVQVMKNVQFQAQRYVKAPPVKAIVPLFHDSIKWPTPISKKAAHSSGAIEDKPITWPKPKLLERSKPDKRYPTKKPEATVADKRRIIQKKENSAQTSKTKDLQLTEDELPEIQFIEGNNNNLEIEDDTKEKNNQKSIIEKSKKPETLESAFMALKH